MIRFSRSPRLSFWSLVLASLSITSPLRAQPPLEGRCTEAWMDAEFELVKAARKDGDCDAALRRLAALYSCDPTDAGVLLNIAWCAEAQNDLVSAVAWTEAALPLFEGTPELANLTERRRVLAARRASFRVQGFQPGLHEILLDGRALSDSEAGAAGVHLNPGTHEITVRIDGQDDVTQVQVSEGESLVFPLGKAATRSTGTRNGDLPPLAASEPPLREAWEPTSEGVRGWRPPWSPQVITFLTVGVAGLATGTGFFIDAASRSKALQERCPGTAPCALSTETVAGSPGEFDVAISSRETGRRSERVGAIMLAAGAAATAVAGLLLVLASPGTVAAAPTTRVTALVGKSEDGGLKAELGLTSRF